MNPGNIGSPLSRVDGVELVTGRAQFTADLSWPGMVYACVHRAGVPSGRIRHVNIAKAITAPGVLAVLLPSDIPGPNIIGILPPFDQPLLTSRDIRYQGDGLAVVVAESRAQAERAVGLIETEIEPLSPVLDPEEALLDSARPIHPQGNIAFHRELRKGDIEVGFAQADVVVEEAYQTSFQEHAYMEPEAVLAIPESDGRITVYASCQSPFHIRGHVASNLAWPASRVRVIQPFVGGSFGGKDDVATEMACLACIAAIQVSRPVKMVHSREEVMTGANFRHAARIKIKTGAMRDGSLIARQIDILLDGGAYASESPFVVMKSLIHAAGPYRIPHIHVSSTAVYTNKVYAGAMRGFGVPQVTYASESQMDELAQRLNLDRLALRKRNALNAGDANATNQVFSSSVGLLETIQKVEERVDWPVISKGVYALDRSRFRRGTGLACMFQGISNGAEGIDVVGASIQMAQDGSVLVAVGLAEMGQGSRTVYAQIASEVLGVSLPQITVRWADTDLVHDSGPTVASRSTTVGGKAVELAAAAVKDSILKMAGMMFQQDANQIAIADDFVYLVNQPEQRIPLSQVATAAYWTGFPLMHLAFSKAPEAHYDHDTHQGDIYIAYNYGTHFMDVEVDTWTGKVKVLQHLACHDVGRVINQLGAEGQVEGASLMGYGFACTEEILQRDGKVWNPNLSDYWIPTFQDRLPTEVIFVERENPTGPFGAKGVGEPPLAGASAAFANAVSNALGIRFRRLPITPQRVLEEIKHISEQE